MKTKEIKVGQVKLPLFRANQQSCSYIPLHPIGCYAQDAEILLRDYPRTLRSERFSSFTISSCVIPCFSMVKNISSTLQPVLEQ